MSSKAPVKPVWWKNTFFLFGIMLILLGLFGLVRGEQAIRDPGQKFESGLVIFYVLGGVAMLLNGWMTHSQSIQQYSEFLDANGLTERSVESETDAIEKSVKGNEEEQNG